jgi:hypothetical protein
MHLLEKLGGRVLDPQSGAYQLESKAGTGLTNEHAEYLGLDLNRLGETSGGMPLLSLVSGT